jgi:hypothetical protein
MLSLTKHGVAVCGEKKVIEEIEAVKAIEDFFSGAFLNFFNSLNCVNCLFRL